MGLRKMEVTYEHKHRIEEEDRKRQNFKERLRAGRDKSPALSAVESLDASLWLLSLGHVSQALFLACQTVEVALKGFLEGISEVLVAAEERFTWPMLKGLVQAEIQSHPFGHRVGGFVGLNAYNPERTCGPVDAFQRVSEFLPLGTDRKTIRDLFDLRNEIAHYGGVPSSQFQYLGAILTAALPFLRQFYTEAYQLDLDDLITKPVTKQLDVIREFLALVVVDATFRPSEVLAPFSAQLQHRRFLPQAPPDTPDQFRHGWPGGIGDIIWEGRRKEAEARWGKLVDESPAFRCRVCDGQVIVAISPPRQKSGRVIVDAEALDCVDCGLFIDKKYRLLAQLHFGPIEI